MSNLEPIYLLHQSCNHKGTGRKLEMVEDPSAGTSRPCACGPIEREEFGAKLPILCLTTLFLWSVCIPISLPHFCGDLQIQPVGSLADMDPVSLARRLCEVINSTRIHPTQAHCDAYFLIKRALILIVFI